MYSVIPTDIVSKCAWAEKVARSKVYQDHVYDRIEIRHVDMYLSVLKVMAPNADADFALFTFSPMGVELGWMPDTLDWGQRCVSDTRAIVSCTWDYKTMPPVHLALNIAKSITLIDNLIQDQLQLHGRHVDLNLVIEFRQGHQFFKLWVERHQQEESSDSTRESLTKRARKSRSKRKTNTPNVALSASSVVPFHVDQHHEYKTYEEQDDEDQVRQRMIEEETAEKHKEEIQARSFGASEQTWTRNELSRVVCPLDFSLQDKQRRSNKQQTEQQDKKEQHIAPFVVENYPSNELDYAFQAGENAFVNPYVRFRISANAFETSANGEAGYIHFLLVSQGNQAYLSHLHQQYQLTYHSPQAHERLGSGKDMITTDFWTYTVERMERSKRHTVPLTPDGLCPTLGSECVFVRILRFHLVPFFTVSCWLRYGYSMDDVKRTCKPFRSCLLWLVAISNRIQLEASAVKASNAVEYVMVWGAKSNAIKTIQDKYIPRVYPQIKDVKESVLCCTIKEHKPCLPVVSLESIAQHSNLGLGTLQACLDRLPSKEDLSLAQLPIAQVFSWKDIEFVPRRKEANGKFLCCVRVLPERVFTAEIHGEPTCIALKPQVVVLPTGTRYCLTEEAFLVPLPKAEKGKRKRSDGETTNEDAQPQPASRKKARNKKELS